MERFEALSNFFSAMRINHPVSQRNYDFPADQTLISITDTKGRITYCNDDFVAVSGYHREELLGQPHNLLRHPDMPAEAFRDFWATIQSGMPWTAVIKNRRKDGDHYWVRASATPMRDGERIVGYLSVRTHPSAQEVASAQQLYATMRAEAQAGKRIHILEWGNPKRRDLAGRLHEWLRISPRTRSILINMVVVTIPLALLSFGLPLWLAWVLGLACVISTCAWQTFLDQRPVKDVVTTARLLASGDLSQFITVPERGMGRRLLLPIAQLGLSIRTVMSDVRSDLTALETAAQSIAAGSRDLAQRTEMQSESLERSASAMEQIHSTVHQTSALADSGVQMVRQAAATTERSQEAVRGMTSTMEEIAESARRIGAITQNIEGVAFQTNILALNAAVEAARAGEQGRGFAVVASEVRALAQHTTSLAKEIRDLIAESGQRVTIGSERASEARQRMDEVVASVQQMGEVLAQINQAAQEQTAGVVQVTQAVQAMDSIAQQNADLVVHLASSAAQMEQQTSAARDNIRVFRLSSQDRTHAETDAVALRKAARQHALLTEPDNHNESVII